MVSAIGTYDHFARKKTIETLQVTKSQSGTARLLRISFDQVHRVMHRAVERGMALRDSDELYKYVSIDEKAISRGHEYASILSDELSGIVIEVSKGRTKESVDNLCIKGLSEEQRGAVERICTDMWDPYIYAAKEHFGQALHCHDNFHLVGYLNKAVDKVRRREVKLHEDLKRTKYLWLKDTNNFTDKQYATFEAIRGANYEVSRAWQVKENFRDIQFRQENYQSALSIYMFWKQNALRVNIPEINQVVEMFDRHKKGIVNAILTGASNARAERLNSSIEEIKRIGRGYRKFENFRIAILFFNANLKLYPHENQ